MSRRIKSDHVANGPHGYHWKAGQTVTLKDEHDNIADDLLAQRGFIEVGADAPEFGGLDEFGNETCPTCGQSWNSRALPINPPDQIGEGREVTLHNAVPMALGGPVREGVTPEVTDAQAEEDRRTAGGTKEERGKRR